MATALPCYNSSRNENINLRIKKISSKRLLFSKNEEIKLCNIMLSQQSSNSRVMVKQQKIEIYFLWTFAFILCNQNESTFSKEQGDPSEGHSFWLSMINKPQLTLHFVSSRLQTPFPERISVHSFIVTFTTIIWYEDWYRKVDESRSSSFASIYLEALEIFFSSNLHYLLCHFVCFSTRLLIMLNLISCKSKKLWMRNWNCSEWYLLFLFPSNKYIL